MRELLGSASYFNGSRVFQIWALEMSTTRKLGISGMFLLGAMQVARHIVYPISGNVLMKYRTVGAGIAKLVFFNKIVRGCI